MNHLTGWRLVVTRFLLSPFLIALATWTILLVTVALIPTSSLHVYIFLCGTLQGHVFSLLLLSWVCVLLRRLWHGIQCLVHYCTCLQGKGRYRSLSTANSLTNNESWHDHEEDHKDPTSAIQVDSSAATTTAPITQCSYNHEDPFLKFDLATTIILYLVLCLFAWFFWSPPTFDSRHANANSSLVFPPSFLFGAATSSYQVEGHIYNNQWADFENDTHVKNGQHCGAAADVWNRFESDLHERIVSDLHLNSFRLSVEWSRIEPEQGVFDEDVLDRYASWISHLREHGVQPILTLHHFTNPLWFERLGAFENDTAPDLILPFTTKVVARLGEYVDLWVTLNEIMVYAGNGYLIGEFPPARSGELGTMLNVVGNMLRCHQVMYHAIKQAYPEAKVSIAKNTILYQPQSFFDLFSVVSATISDVYYNAMPIRVLQQQQTLDYLGLNSYIRMKVGSMGTWMGFVFSKEKKSDMGWDLEPQVLYQVIKQYHAYAPGLDIIITEHGVADGESPDVRRVEFLRDSLVGLALGMNLESLPVVGYMHWSLVDNWEWSSGFDPKFGLYHIDLPDSQERILTEGGKVYREIVATRRIGPAT